jgi:hypothetical protein
MKPLPPISRHGRLCASIAMRTTPTSCRVATTMPSVTPRPSRHCKLQSRHGTIGLCPILQLAACLVILTGLCSHSQVFRVYASHPHTLPHPPHPPEGIKRDCPFPHPHPALPLPSPLICLASTTRPHALPARGSSWVRLRSLTTRTMPTCALGRR